MDRFEDAVGRRGREHIARDCRIEHTEPNIARVRRFMAAAAAGNDGDLFLVRLAARDHLKAGDISEAAVRYLYACQHLGYYVFRIVDYFLHRSSPCKVFKIRETDTSASPFYTQ